MIKKMGWLVLLASVFLLPATSAWADETPRWTLDEGRIFVDEDVVLQSGEVFRGDLGVFNGSLSVPIGAEVLGDVFVTQGNIDLAGTVTGDLVIVNGRLVLSESGHVTGNVFGGGQELDIAGQVDGDLTSVLGTARLRNGALIKGNLTVLSGQLERDPGAQVLGEQLSQLSLPELPNLPILPERLILPEVQVTPPSVPEFQITPPVVPEAPAPFVPPVQARPYHEPFSQKLARFVGRALSATVMGLLFVGIGVLIAFLWTKPTRRVSTCIQAMPAQSFGLGILTFLLALVLEAVAAVLMMVVVLLAAALIGTVILIPIGLLLMMLSVLLLVPVPLLLAGGMIQGWVGLADLLGQKVMQALKIQDGKPVGSVLVGMLLTVGIAASFWLIAPVCGGWPVIILLTSLGLGAVIHTRFGTRDCRLAPASVVSDVLPPEAMDEEEGQPDTSP
jgi:cytoskeletal protein CcmA (bactofilin family)